MAVLTLYTEGTTIQEPGEIRRRLGVLGVDYSHCATLPAIETGRSSDDLLSDLAPVFAPIRPTGARGAEHRARTEPWKHADIVDIHPGVEDLDALLSRFASEHSHSEDEIRLILAGRGMFHLHVPDENVVSVEVTPGDCIRVPAHTRHWFHVCPSRRCRAVRLFLDPSGWAPSYTHSGIDLHYPPLWHPETVSTDDAHTPAAPRG